MSNGLKEENLNKTTHELKNELEKYSLQESLSDNINLFKKSVFNNDDSIIYRKFKNNNIKFCAIFVDGMVNNTIINENVISPILKCNINDNLENIIEYIDEEVIAVNDVIKTENLDEIVSGILYGDTLLLIDGEDKGLIINTKGWKTRSITEPQSESVVIGPREGFTESINVNLSLIRRRINNQDLKFKFRKIGTRSRTRVAIVYVEGIVNNKILNELEKRLDKIDIDGVFCTETIDEFIEDSVISPFRSVGKTERPDVVSSKLLEGRIAVFSDGCSYALTLPYIFIENFQVNEDYYTHFIYGSFNRLLRFIAFFLTTSTPAIFVAITTFHREMLPTKLAMSIYLAREGVPFPTVIESFGMLVTFEIIREAGVRLPKHIGSAVSIVGALVLGQAAVNARFVSAPMVIVTAITGICSFILPQMQTTLIVIRGIFLIMASFLGLYGYIFAVMGVLIHLVSLRSFGVPYMLKINSINAKDIKDTAIRYPWNLLEHRTKFISKDSRRINNEKRRNRK
ncbi:spore germination protein [Haloimpatiens sp. FM7330]|uniref:spore germination protein n=1 Tax=Haloimpatiens sp. FM7330 TaxID=3298610 RepID=UPI0036288826